MADITHGAGLKVDGECHNDYLRTNESDGGVEIDHHESDLYVPVNDVTQRIIEAYEFKSNVQRFVSQIDRTLWYDIPFAYDPFWLRGEAEA